MQLVVRVVRNNELDSQTVMEPSNVKFDQPSVTEDQFSQRRLEQGL